MTVGTRIQLRRDSAGAWTAANPVLASGEQGIETDTQRLKRGDGVTAWNALPYVFDNVAASVAFQPLSTDLTTIAGLSSATAGALGTDGSGWVRKTYAQLKAALGLVKADVGLGSADNTSDASKPVSTAQQAALNAKLDISAASATYEAKVEAPGNNPLGDAVALASAHAALPAGGGRLLLQAGAYDCAATGVTFTKPTTLVGEGGRFVSTSQGGTFPGSAITTIKFSSRTANCLTFAAPGSQIIDLAVVNTNDNTTPPTAGTGVTFSVGHNCGMARATVAGFYDNVKFAGRFGTIECCHIFDPVHYGLNLTYVAGQGDFGDSSVSNTVIAMYGRTSDATAAVHWDGGGGIRWTNNKIVAGSGPGASGIGVFTYGMDLMVADGVSTVEWMIFGGGISSCSTACLRIGQAGTTGGISRVNVEGVVFQGSGSGTTGVLVGASSTGTNNGVRCVTIAYNTFTGVGPGIVAYNMRALTIGPNTWDTGCTGPLITLAGGNDDGTGMWGVYVAKQNVGELTGIDLILDKRRLTSSAAASSGPTDYGMDATMFANVVGTWVTVGYIDLPTTDGGSALVELELSGYDYSVGALYARYRRVLTKAGGSSAVTVATDGTDLLAGATTHHAVQFVTTTNNRVIVQYKLDTGGVTIWGKARLAATGFIARSHLGA